MNAPDWQAQWIWATETSETRHFYFRRDFVLPSKPASATLRITADDRYRVDVNSRDFGYGPARSAPAYQSYDEYETQGNLRQGRNRIAVRAAHYGIGTAYSCNGRPGLLAQLDMTFDDGSTLTIATDAEWKTYPAPYETGFERMCIMLAYPEVFDARREPTGWDWLEDFDVSDWQNAVVIGAVGIEPWTNLIRRGIPLTDRLGYGPWRLLMAHQAQKSAGELERRTPAEDMERATRFEDIPLESILHERGGTIKIAPQSGEKGVSITLDFGREVSGSPRFTIESSKDGRIDIGYSERLEANGAVNPNRWGRPARPLCGQNLFKR